MDLLFLNIPGCVHSYKKMRRPLLFPISGLIENKIIGSGMRIWLEVGSCRPSDPGLQIIVIKNRILEISILYYWH